MSNKLVLGVAWVLSLVLTAGVTYYGGNYYEEAQRMRQLAERTGLSVEQIRQTQQQNGGGMGFAGRGMFGGGGAGFAGGATGMRTATGKVDAVEGDVITITTVRGSQKITLQGGAKVSKSAPAEADDIKPGQVIWAEGEYGSDGSFEASAVVQVK